MDFQNLAWNISTDKQQLSKRWTGSEKNRSKRDAETRDKSSLSGSNSPLTSGVRYPRKKSKRNKTTRLSRFNGIPEKSADPFESMELDSDSLTSERSPMNLFPDLAPRDLRMLLSDQIDRYNDFQGWYFEDNGQHFRCQSDEDPYALDPVSPTDEDPYALDPILPEIEEELHVLEPISSGIEVEDHIPTPFNVEMTPTNKPIPRFDTTKFREELRRQYARTPSPPPKQSKMGSKLSDFLATCQRATDPTSGVHSLIEPKYRKILSEILSLSENIGLTIWHLSKCETFGDAFMALYTAYRLFNPNCRNIVSEAYSLGNHLFTGLKGFTPQSKEVDDESSFFGICDNFVDKFDFSQLREALSNLSAIRNSKLVKVVTDLTCYFMCLPVLRNSGIDPFVTRSATLRYHEVLAVYADHKTEFALDFTELVLNTYEFLRDRFTMFVQTGSVSYLISEKPLVDWMERADNICREYNLPTFANTVDMHTFKYQLEVLVQEGVDLSNAAGNTKFVKKMLVSKLDSVKTISAELSTSTIMAKPRRMPFGVYLFGDSGQGKTFLMDFMFESYSRCAKLHRDETYPAESAYKYKRTFESEYWTRIKPHTWFIILDEIGDKRIKEGSVDQSTSDTMSLLNTVPFDPPQASLEDKGKIRLDPRLVIATGNQEFANVKLTQANPFAFFRRFNFSVKLTVKECFRDPETKMVDKSKIPARSDYSFDNIWQFEVFEARPVSQGPGGKFNQGVEWCSLHKFDDIEDFNEFYWTRILEHEKDQDVAMEKNSTTGKLRMCMHGRFTCSMCSTFYSADPEDRTKTVGFSPQGDEEEAEILYDQSTLSLRWCSTIIIYWLIFLRWGIESLHGFISVCLRIHKEKFLADRDLETRQRPSEFFSRLLYHLQYFYCRYASQWLVLGAMRLDTYILMITCYVNRRRLVFNSLAVLGAVAACAYVIRVLYKSSANSFRPQGNSGSKPAPFEKESEKQIFWNMSEMKNSDVPIKVKSMKGMSTSAIEKKLQKSLFRVYVRKKNGKIARGNAIQLYGLIFACNRHFFHEGAESITIFKDNRAGISNRKTAKWEGIYKQEFPEKDLIIFAFPNYDMGQDLVSLFRPSSCPVTASSAQFLALREDENHVVSKFTAQVYKLGEHPCSTGGIYGLLPSMNFLHYSLVNKNGMEFSKDGDCGGLIWRMTPNGPLIYGFHSGITSVYSLGVALDREFLENVLKDFPGVFKTQAGTLSGLGTHRATYAEELHRKALTRFIEKGSCQIMGSVNASRRTNKSKVIKTDLCDYLVHRTVDSDYPITDWTRPPMMVSYVPKRLALQHLVNTNEEEHFMDFSICADHYIKRVKDHLHPDYYSSLQVYDDFTVLNGAAGVCFVDRMNFNTSAGYPFYETKKHWIVPIESANGIDNCYGITPEVQTEVDRIDKAWRSGERAHIVFVAHLKDEPVSEEKARIGKTRVFCSATFAASIVIRRYTLSFVRLMQRERFLFEGTAGINVLSSQWSEMVDYITYFGDDRIVAGDYSKYDKRMSPHCILLAFRIIREICSLGSHTAEDLRAIDSMAADIAYPTTDYFGELLGFFGSNPSGHPLTIIVNSLVNSVYIRYAYLVNNPFRTLATFNEDVHLLTNGDDNIMNVSSRAYWFSHTSISKVLKEVGVVYTLPDKSDRVEDYMTIQAATYLSRSPVFHADIGEVVAALSLDSISKSLTRCVPGADYDRVIHMVTVMNSALREYALHGRFCFEEKRKLFEAAAREHGYNDLYSFKFLTYEEIIANYNYETTRGLMLFRGCHEVLEYDVKRLKPQMKESVGKLDWEFVSRASRPTRPSHSEQANIDFRPQGDEREDNVQPSSTINGVMTVPPSSKDVDMVDTYQQEVLTFRDDNPHQSVVFKSVTDETFSSDRIETGSLDSFIERPVRIAQYSYVQGTTPADFRFSPWQLFFNDPTVKRKIDNFGLIQCNLHVRVSISASPFYYGYLRMSYNPKPLFSAFIEEGRATNYVQFSQRPGIDILPQLNQGGEMVLPFFHNKNWLQLTSSGELSEMGELRITQITELQHAQSVAGGLVRVQIWAWATDVKMSGPTTLLAVQSDEKSGGRDEYGQGPVSRIASGAAWVASKLKEIPLLRPYATATEIGANAASKILTIFGFTDVPVIDDVKPVKNMPFQSLTSGGIGEPVTKLTLDPKQELTIDPRTVGLGDGDELSIAYLVQRETLLEIVSWTAEKQVSDLLFTCPVQPQLYKAEAISGGVQLDMPPMCGIASLFDYWRGDIIFRFKVICSRYHCGRLSITWDPYGDLVANADTTSQAFNKIVDINPETDFELRCDYSQARHFLDTRNVEAASVGGGEYQKVSGFTNEANPISTNGSISIRVLNELSSPDSTSDVQILVYVRGADNLEFMGPHSKYTARTSYFRPQSDMVDSNTFTCEPEREPHAQSYRVYGGERIGSIRPLMRRAVLDSSSSLGPLDAVMQGNDSVIVKRFDQRGFRQPGYVSNGDLGVEAVSLIGGANTRYTWGKLTAATLVVPWFKGKRGSYIRHYNLDTSSSAHQQIHNVTISRLRRQVASSELGGTQRTTYAGLPASNQASTTARFYGTNMRTGSSGLMVNNCNTQNGMSVLCPQYSPFRFQITNPLFNGNGALFDGSISDEVEFTMEFRPNRTKNFVTDDHPEHETQGKDIVIHQYVSIGTDFNVFFFLNVPSMFVYSSIPDAVAV